MTNIIGFTILAISYLFRFQEFFYRESLWHSRTGFMIVPGLLKTPLEEPQVRKHVTWTVTLPQADTGCYPLHLPLSAGASLTFEVDLDHA